MSITLQLPKLTELRPRITVIGVGGAGCNAVNNMIAAGLTGVEFVVANTDAQALVASSAEHRLQLGINLTEGLGAGSKPEIGEAAAEEAVDEIRAQVSGSHMLFIAAGMGGGTGTGACAVIARVARELGILTVGVVTKPFMFEGTRRQRTAEAGVAELKKHVDTLIVIPNQNLFLVAKAETTFKEAFELADEVLQQGVRSITDLMVMPGLINLDFADVRSVMGEMGKAMMGTGEGEGENRALEAAERAIANPLLDGVSMQGAKGVIISIIGGDDMKLLEVDEAANHIRELVDPDANIIWGSAFNPDLSGKIRVSVVATGIEQTAAQAEDAARPLNLGMSRGPVRPVAAVPPAPEPEPEPEPAPQRLFDGVRQESSSPESPGAEPVSAGSEPAPEPAESAAPEIPQASNDELPPAVSSEDDGDEGEEESSGAYASLSGAKEQPAEPLDLGLDQIEDDAADGGGGKDELLLDATRLAEEDAPVAPMGGRRRKLVSDDYDEDSSAPQAPAPGSTLFERMANLSRGGKPAADQEDEDDSEDGSSISIPRFLGRQNNQ